LWGKVDVAVFIDWQNVYGAAREAFGLEGQPTERGVVSPLALARILAAGNKRGTAGNLVRVEIHRGVPDPTKKCQVAIIFSHGTDLLPPVETICRLVKPERVEKASWKRLLPQTDPPCEAGMGRTVRRRDHTIRVEVFDQVETPINYLEARPARPEAIPRQVTVCYLGARRYLGSPRTGRAWRNMVRVAGAPSGAMRYPRSPGSSATIRGSCVLASRRSSRPGDERRGSAEPPASGGRRSRR
jgi:hypothetical protein